MVNKEEKIQRSDLIPVTWANMHTHTWRCKHASGDVRDYAKVAATGGMTVLGMADHSPLPDGRWIDHRMEMSQLDDYIVQVRGCTVPGVRVLLGLECDWDPDFRSFYRDELLAQRGFDYLIAGCHFTPYSEGDRHIPGGSYQRWFDNFNCCTTPARLRAYAAHVTATMASGLFSFITHPDLFGACNSIWTADTAACAKDICAASVALGVPLEINSYGVRKPWVAGYPVERPGYPWAPFWEVAAASGVRVVLSSDAHRAQDLFSGYAQVAEIRDRYGLIEAELPILQRQRS